MKKPRYAQAVWLPQCSAACELLAVKAEHSAPIPSPSAATLTLGLSLCLRQGRQGTSEKESWSQPRDNLQHPSPLLRRHAAEEAKPKATSPASASSSQRRTTLLAAQACSQAALRLLSLADIVGTHYPQQPHRAGHPARYQASASSPRPRGAPRRRRRTGVRQGACEPFGTAARSSRSCGSARSARTRCSAAAPALARRCLAAPPPAPAACTAYQYMSVLLGLGFKHHPGNTASNAMQGRQGGCMLGMTNTCAACCTSCWHLIGTPVAVSAWECWAAASCA